MLAKTTRPRLSAIYQRSRLFEQLDAARNRYANTLVSGPPGSGKTTLISSYIELRNLRCLWYQIDSGDEDVATFFHYFSQAATPHRAPAARALPVFLPAAAPDLTRFSREYFRELFSGLQVPLVLVFDNYEALRDSSAVHAALRVACEETPDSCRIVIASRHSCPKPLARMHSRQALGAIGPEDLALTLEETHGIAEAQGVRLASAAHAQALRTRIAGWMMGLILMLERNQTGGDANLSLSLRGDGEERVFDYFIDEVFRKYDARSRDLLMQSALLPTMTIRAVTELTHAPKSAALLRELAGKNHFVMRLAGSVLAYQFHPLFREFLLDQARTRYSQSELAALYSAAAEVLIAEGDLEAAMAILAKAQDWHRMVELILAAAPALTAQGRTATLDGWIRTLPLELIEGNAWMLYWYGTTKSFSDSGVSLAMAYQRFNALEDLPGMALSWSGIVEAIFRAGRDFRQMDAWIVQFDERLAPRLDELPPELRARISLAFFVALTYRQPLHPDLSRWRERVQDMLAAEPRAAERAALRQHLVMHHILRGEHAQAEAALGVLHPADDPAVTEQGRSTPPDRASEAMVAMHLGMEARCIRAVTEGLIEAEGTGNRTRSALLLQIGAAMSLNRDQPVRAAGFLSALERLHDATPYNDLGLYYAVAGWRKHEAGEPVLALHLLRRAVAAAEARDDPYWVAANHLGLGLMLALAGCSREAFPFLELGRAIGAAIDNPALEYIYHLFSAHALGGGDKAREHLVSAMALGRQHGYMHFVFFPPRIIAKLCLAALDAGIETGYVRALIERNELVPDPAWRHAGSWPWPLRIYTLGRFGIVKQGVRMLFTGKAQKKPLELLEGPDRVWWARGAGSEACRRAMA